MKTPEEVHIEMILVVICITAIGVLISDLIWWRPN